MANAPAHLDSYELKVNITNQQILKVSLPIALSILVPQLNFLTNNIFLGMLGRQPLAIAGITGVFYLCFAVIGHGLNSGLQSLISRRAGEDKIGEINSFFTQAVFISFFFALFGVAFTWVFAPILLKFALHDAAIIEGSISFLRIRIFGLFFLYLYQMRNALLISANQSKYLVIGTAAESITNILLDYLLIFGVFGLPKLGFNGAAYASIIAEATGLAITYWVIHAQGIGKKLQLFQQRTFQPAFASKLLKQSLPLMTQHFISIVTWEIFYILIEHHGEKSLAISNTMRNIFGFFGCFTFAFAATTNSMVSNIIGQGKHHQVKPLIFKIMRFSLGFSSMVCVLLNCFPSLILSFYSQGNDFVTSAVPVLRVVTIALLIMSISIVLLNSVTAFGQTKITLLIEFIAIVFYLIYNYIVLEKLNLPIAYGWASEWIYWSVILVCALYYLKKIKWKGKTL